MLNIESLMKLDELGTVGFTPVRDSRKLAYIKLNEQFL